jgi:hypothetical protein
MLRLLGYILEKRLPRKLREIDDSDLYLRMLLLTPSIPTELDYIEPLWDGTKIIDLNKRKEEQDEHTTVQSA